MFAHMLLSDTCATNSLLGKWPRLNRSGGGGDRRGWQGVGRTVMAALELVMTMGASSVDSDGGTVVGNGESPAK